MDLHYCVLRTTDEAEQYAGPYEALAAEALHPGTVYAIGDDPARAFEIARRRARLARGIRGGYAFPAESQIALKRWRRTSAAT
jgi:hypothetical protein